MTVDCGQFSVLYCRYVSMHSGCPSARNTHTCWRTFSCVWHTSQAVCLQHHNFLIMFNNTFSSSYSTSYSAVCFAWSRWRWRYKSSKNGIKYPPSSRKAGCRPNDRDTSSGSSVLYRTALSIRCFTVGTNKQKQAWIEIVGKNISFFEELMNVAGYETLLLDSVSDCVADWLTVWLADWLCDGLTDWPSDWADFLTDWLTDLLTDWLTNWLTGWLTYWLTGSLSGLTDLLTGWLVDWLTDWLAGWMTGLTDFLTDWLGWFVDWLVDWLTNWLPDWLAGLTVWLTNQPTNQSTKQITNSRISAV